MTPDSFPTGEPSSPPISPGSFTTSAGDPSEVAAAYGRQGNPTWSALEQQLGRNEDAHCVVFASGQAASMGLLLCLAERRPRLVAPSDGYYGMRVLAEKLGPRGIVSAPCDHADLDAVDRALAAGDGILWTETPTNPFLRVFDLAALAQVARGTETPFVVDNTTATSALQRPLEHGALATMTSLTKATSGHSDVILGAVCTRDAELAADLRAWRQAGGGIPGPFEAWTALRGVRTLSLRVERQSSTALAIARHLLAHPEVDRVHYPGTNEASLEVAHRQMSGGFGPLLSFEVRGDAARAEAVVRGAELVRPGTSFGGVESTWERRARWAAETAPENLIRMSAGIEDEGQLIADIDRALGH